MAHPLHRVSVPGRIFDITNYILLALFALTILYPFWTVVINSLNPPETPRGLGFHIWNDVWSVRETENPIGSNAMPIVKAPQVRAPTQPRRSSRQPAPRGSRAGSASHR